MRIVNNLLSLKDLSVYIAVVKYGSFVKAADALGVSPAYISKRVQLLENTFQCTLLYRNTRKLSLTDNGRMVYEHGIKLMDKANYISEMLADNAENLQGFLAITSSLGFGRSHIAPILSDFAKAYPHTKYRFDTVDTLCNMIEEQIDLDIRVGNDISPELIAKPLYKNRRILCASPDYLTAHSEPIELSDLLPHQCLVIKERDHPFGVWELTNNTNTKQRIRVSGDFSSNNGEIIKIWCLAGQGIMLRSMWDVHTQITQGKLVHILTDYWQEADIWAVYPERLKNSAKLRVCVEFIRQNIQQRLDTR